MQQPYSSSQSGRNNCACMWVWILQVFIWYLKKYDCHGESHQGICLSFLPEVTWCSLMCTKLLLQHFTADNIIIPCKLPTVHLYARKVHSHQSSILASILNLLRVEKNCDPDNDCNVQTSVVKPTNRHSMYAELCRVCIPTICQMDIHVIEMSVCRRLQTNTSMVVMQTLHNSVY